MDADSLRNALRKRKEGRGLKNSEITALRQFDRAEIFSSKPRKEPARISEADTRTTLTAGKDTLWQESQESSSSEGGYTEGAAVEVVQGSDSKLVKVVTHSTSTTPTAFPVILKTIASGVTGQLDGAGISVTSSGFDFYVTPSTAIVGAYTATRSIVFDLSGSEPAIAVTRSANSLSIREIDVCDAGVAKKMLVLASAPY